MKKLAMFLLMGGLAAELCGVGLAQTTTQTPPADAPVPTPVAREAVVAPDKTVTDMLEILMGAIEDDSYTMFIAPMAESVKAALPKPAFEAVVQMMGPRITAGYKTNFIDSVKHQNVTTYLWKIKFTDKGDDMIALLTIKDGKAAAFLLL